MFELNLLPPREIKKIEIKCFSNFLGCFSIRIAFLLIVFVLLLLSTLFSLMIILKSQNELIDIRRSDKGTRLLEEIK